MQSHQPRNPPCPITDALIVGGGPAGLAAAIALRQQNLHCTVVDAQSPGIEKACGEGLMPDALDALESLGVHLSAADGHPFLGIRFANSTHSVDARFPRRAGLGVRRPNLHRLLAAQAQAAGADLRWNARVHLIDRGAATVDGQPIAFRFLIGADGQASSLRRWAGLDATRRDSRRFGFRTHYRIAPWSDFVEVHWSPAGQLYITPIAPDCICVVYVARNRNRHFSLADFPEVAARLGHAQPISQQRGAVSATRQLRRVATTSVALIGDASGSADSITGDGLAMSFRQALALAQAISAGGLEPYAQSHRKIARLPHAMGALMLSMDRWPALQLRVIRALAAHPHIFRDLLAAHLGARSLARVALSGGPRLGWNLLLPPA